MPGTTMIGDSRAVRRWRPTSLPAEARALCRFLRLLGNPGLASQVLLACLDQKSSLYAQLQDTLTEMGRHGWKGFLPGHAENRMSLALHVAILNSTKHRDVDSSSSSNKTRCIRNQASAVMEADNDEPIVTSTKHPQTKSLSPRAAVVSDSSGVSSADEEEESAVEVSQTTAATSTALVTPTEVIKKHWGRVLEALHLQIASRTTRVWGRKKIYEIYKLSSPIKNVTDWRQACLQVEKEFRTIFHGGGEDQSGCRTYARVADCGIVYFQVNIGKCYDFQDESNRAKSGEKKKKKPNEYVALLEPNSCLIALTASRAPSGRTCRFTKYVLVALEAALATTDVARANTKSVDDSLVPKRFGDWTGTEPIELLEDAKNSQSGRAVGRFAKLARDAIEADPLEELHAVSTESLVDRSREVERLEAGRKHGRHVARLQKQHSGGALVAATSNADGVLVDGAAHAKKSRKRARDAALGEEGDCPALQRIAWKWSGRTSAAAMAVLGEDHTACDRQIEFKCGVVMEGTNVFEGLRSLVAAGLTKPTLPDYVKDAPTLGSTTITVDHGEFGGTESFAAV